MTDADKDWLREFNKQNPEVIEPKGEVGLELVAAREQAIMNRNKIHRAK